MAAPPNEVRVLIADDHGLFAEALTIALMGDDEIAVIGLSHSAVETLLSRARRSLAGHARRLLVRGYRLARSGPPRPGGARETHAVPGGLPQRTPRRPTDRVVGSTQPK